MSIADLELTLRRLCLDQTGEVFWLTTTPDISGDELDLRLSCL